MKKIIFKMLGLIVSIGIIFSSNLIQINSFAATDADSEFGVFFSKFKDDCTVLKFFVDGQAHYGVIDLGGDGNCSKFIASVVGKSNCTLDFLILTHYHNDHISGLESLKGTATDNGVTRKFDIKFKTAYINQVGQKLDGNGLSIVSTTFKNKLKTYADDDNGNLKIVEIAPKTTTNLTFGDTKLKIFGSIYARNEKATTLDGTPVTDITGAGNVNSHSLYITALDKNSANNRNIQYFFGGDLTPSAWMKIINSYPTLDKHMAYTSTANDVVVYKSSHHGIRTSFSTLAKEAERSVFNFLSNNNQKIVKNISHYYTLEDEFNTTMKYTNFWFNDLFKAGIANNTCMFVYDNGSFLKTFDKNKVNSNSEYVLSNDPRTSRQNFKNIRSVSTNGYFTNNLSIGTYTNDGIFKQLKTIE